MANTLLLDRTAWDLCIDASGNIAMATEPYSLAQDAASAIRLFQGDYWFDTSLGIPYFKEILGHNPPINLMKQLFIDAAESVPNIAKAIVYFSSISSNGQVSGQVQITDINGDTSLSEF